MSESTSLNANAVARIGIIVALVYYGIAMFAAVGAVPASLVVLAKRAGAIIAAVLMLLGGR